MHSIEVKPFVFFWIEQEKQQQKNNISDSNQKTIENNLMTLITNVCLNDFQHVKKNEQRKTTTAKNLLYYTCSSLFHLFRNHNSSSIASCIATSSFFYYWHLVYFSNATIKKLILNHCVESNGKKTLWNFCVNEYKCVCVLLLKKRK